MSNRLVANDVEWESEGGIHYAATVEVVWDWADESFAWEAGEQAGTEVQFCAEVESIRLIGAVLVEEDVAVDASLLEALAVTNRSEILHALEPLLANIGRGDWLQDDED